jgi:hypothetical protein
MVEDRSLSLLANFLADRSGIVPVGLEYIRWGIKDHKLLYRPEKRQCGQLEALECEPLRPFGPTSEADAWMSESVLDRVT